MKKKNKKILLGIVGAATIPTALLSAYLAVKPYPTKGWQQDYTDFVVTKVTGISEIMTLPGPRMSWLTPNWGSMAHGARAAKVATLIRCMALAESDHDRLSMYRELGISGFDSVTGRPTVSEGLLQISYADMRNYRGECKFDWEKDKASFLKDLDSHSGRQSFDGTDGRTILDPMVNLSCGIEMMRQLAANPRYKTSTARYAWGRYWSTLRPEGPGYRKVMNCVGGQ